MPEVVKTSLVNFVNLLFFFAGHPSSLLPTATSTDIPGGRPILWFIAQPDFRRNPGSYIPSAGCRTTRICVRPIASAGQVCVPPSSYPLPFPRDSEHPQGERNARRNSRDSVALWP